MERAWEEAGAWKVADGVWRVPLPLPNDGLRTVNVYVLEANDGIWLVDGGWAVPDSEARLEWALSLLGWAIEDIRCVLATHVHRDHYTGALALARRCGARVLLGHGERRTLDLLVGPPGEDVRPRYDLLRECGALELAESWRAEMLGDRRVRSRWAFPDEWIEPGDTFSIGKSRLRAVSTPGHTAGHLAFVDVDAGLMFAGDHVLPSITPSIGYETSPAERPLGAYLESLAAVLELPDMWLLPGHGGPKPSVHARAKWLIEYHDARLAECRDALPDSGGTAADVANRIKWTGRGRALAELDVPNAALATLETRAHLELLVERDEAQCHPSRTGVIYVPITKE